MNGVQRRVRRVTELVVVGRDRGRRRTASVVWSVVSRRVGRTGEVVAENFGFHAHIRRRRRRRTQVDALPNHRTAEGRSVLVVKSKLCLPAGGRRQIVVRIV